MIAGLLRKMGLGILIFSALGSTARADETRVTYTDSSGQAWTRWILTEERDGGTLLLVTDNPRAHESDPATTQVVRLRKLYGASEKPALSAAVTKFHDLADLPAQMSGGFRAAIAVPSTSPLPLWVPTKTAWSLDDETAYGAWVSTLTPDYLVGSGLSVDCADFAVTVRWIYAHDHLLPAADTLAGSGKLFGHWSGRSDWDRLPTDPDWRKDARFKAGLRYVLDNTYTHSVFGDLYPVEVNRDYVTPGSIILVLYSGATGHTQVVTSVGSNAAICHDQPCIAVIYGDEPASPNTFANVAWIENLGAPGGGFLRWRWPAFSSSSGWTLTPGPQMPGYSLEQYSQPNLEDERYAIWAEEQLGLPVDVSTRLWADYSGLSQELLDRVNLTALGYLYCGFGIAASPCLPSDPLYDQYSTPGRDARLRSSIQILREDLAELSPGSDPDSIREQLQSPFFPAEGNLFDVPPAIPLNMLDLANDPGGVDEHLSYDPFAPIEMRWGQPSDPDTKLKLNWVAWDQGWEDRAEIVGQAQALCYPNGAVKPTCRASDPAVSALSTARLDGGLANVRKLILSLLPQASAGAQAWITKSGNADAETDVCVDSHGQGLTLNDYLLADSNYFENLSADPTAPLAARFGCGKRSP